MKAVLISINPLWCELIGNGEKTVEVRKNRPKLKTPFKVFIYCTKAKTDGEYLWTAKSTTIGKMHRSKYDICNGGVTIKGYSVQKKIFLITNIKIRRIHNARNTIQR